MPQKMMFHLGKYVSILAILNNIIVDCYDRQIQVSGDKDKQVRIVNGIPARNLKFIVSIILVMRNDEGICAGSLVSPDAVVTAAHCFDGAMDPVANTYIYAGSRKLERGKELRAKQIYVHAKYKYEDFQHDIAVIILKNKLKLGGKMKKIPIPKKLPPIGSAVWAAGYGDATPVSEDTIRESRAKRPFPQKRKDKFGSLYKVKLKLISNAKCGRMIKSELNTTRDLDSDICAYGKNKDACTGDSGGPLFVSKTKKKKHLVGVVSWGVGCADARYPGIYTDVVQFKKWIYKAKKKGREKKITNSKNVTLVQDYRVKKLDD